ncbi:MAG: hypothetical protein JNM56_23515 [Planctomycetia bacterium]|nr:hypothetical protein [Planctomycetia bacterium]
MTEADDRLFQQLVDGDNPRLSDRRFWLWLAAALPLLMRHEQCACRQYLGVLQEEFAVEHAPRFAVARRHAHRQGSEWADACGLRPIYRALEFWLRGLILTSECWGKILEFHTLQNDYRLRCVRRELEGSDSLAAAIQTHRAQNAEDWRKITVYFHDIVDGLLRTAVWDRSWLTANVQSVAQGIYDERAFDRLPILADALEDAGCDHADILNHCRQPGVHVRGCWCVDLLLDKQ